MNLFQLFILGLTIAGRLAGLAVGQKESLPPVFITWNDGRLFTVTPTVERMS